MNTSFQTPLRSSSAQTEARLEYPPTAIFADSNTLSLHERQVKPCSEKRRREEVEVEVEAREVEVEEEEEEVEEDVAVSEMVVSSTGNEY